MEQTNNASINDEENLNYQNNSSYGRKSLLNPQIKTIFEVFCEKDVYYEIPLYQRKYEWNKNLIEGLIDDIFEYIKESKGYKPNNRYKYNIGNIFYYNESKDNNKKRIIVDGQQRLTTIFIILSEIKNFSNSFKNTKYSEDSYFKKANNLKKDISNYFIYLNNEIKIKREYQEDFNFFEKVIKNPDCKNCEDIFSKNRNIIKKRIIYNINAKINTDDFFDKIKNFYENLTENVDLNLIEIDSDANKEHKGIYNQIFENINLKSKSLSIIEIIRNYIFSVFLDTEENDLKEKIKNEFIKFDKQLKNLNEKKEIIKEKDLQKYIGFFLNIVKINTEERKNTSNIFELYKSTKDFLKKNKFNYKNNSELTSIYQNSLIFLDFFNFIFLLKRIPEQDSKNKITNENNKFLWLVESFFDSLISIFYKIYILSKEQEPFLENNEKLKILESKDYQKYTHYIFKLVILNNFKFDDVKNTFWNKIAQDANFKDFYYFKDKIMEEIKLIDTNEIKTKLKSENVYDKKINKTIKFLLFLINNKEEKRKNNYKDFKKIQWEHIMPQILHDKEEKKLNAQDFLNKKEWIFNIKKNYKKEDFLNFKDDEEFQKYAKEEKEYKFLIYYYMNKIHNSTILEKETNNKISNLIFINEKDRDPDQIKLNDPFVNKKEGIGRDSKLNINQYLISKKNNFSFTIKSDFENWGNFLINEILKEIREDKEN